MPDNNTLLAQLLRRPTSIGPGTPRVGGPGIDPTVGMENQQPDPFKTVLDIAGDPLQNIGGVGSGAEGVLHAAAPLAAEGKLIDLIRGGWTDYRPALTHGPAVEKLLETLGDFIKKPVEVPQIGSEGRMGSRWVPWEKDRFLKPPEGFKFDKPMAMERNPAVADNIRQQQRIKAREVRSFNKLPLEQKIAQKGVLDQAKKEPTFFYRTTWGKLDKPTPDIVRSMRGMADTKMSLEEIRDKFPKMDERTIQDILNKKTWVWVK